MKSLLARLQRILSTSPAVELLFAGGFLIASLLFFQLFLRYPAFNLIDDGMSMKVASEVIKTGNFSSVIEIDNGRLRPLYWLYFVIVFLTSSTNPFGYWLGQTLVFALTLFLLWYLATWNIKRRSWASLAIAASSLSLFFVPAITENLFRLGTAEVRQIVMMLLFLWWMRASIADNRPRRWLGLILLLAALLTKETSILLVPMAIVYFLSFIVADFKKYRKFLCCILFGAFIAFLFLITINVLKETAAYTAGFQITGAQIKLNFLTARLQMSELFYATVFLIGLTFSRFLLIVLRRSHRNSLKVEAVFLAIEEFWKDNPWTIALLGGLVGSFVFIFSWEYQLERYYYLTYILLWLYAVSEIVQTVGVLQTTKQIKRARNVFLAVTGSALAISFVFLFQRTIPKLWLYPQRNQEVRNRWFGGYHTSYTIIEWLLQAENLEHVYVTTNDYEVIYELGLYANRLDFDQSKIDIYAPNDEVIVKHPVLHYEADTVAAMVADPSHDKVLISRANETISLPESYQPQILRTEITERFSTAPAWVIWRQQP